MQSPDTHLIFSETIDVLLNKTLSEFVTPDVKERIKLGGIDLQRKLDPAYPVRLFDNAMEAVALHGMANLAPAEAYRRIGELQIEAFQSTFLGKATFQFLKLISREKFIARITKSFRQANNYIESTVTPRADGAILIRINDVGRFPEVIGGVISAAFTAAGHIATVELGARDGLAFEYIVRFPTVAR